MSVFKIPLAVSNDIQRVITRFWWSSKEDKKGIHWLKWEKISHVKIRGGLGFKDFSSFNQALVVTQWWRLLQKPNSLVAKILKVRYFRHADFMEAKLGSNPSFIWRSILWGRKILQQGTRWRVGNGNQALVMGSNWIPRPSRPTFTSSLPPNTKVSDLIDSDHHWNLRLIDQRFAKEDAEAIKKIPLPRYPQMMN
ncbi:hypothetical protein AB3S75_013125 [Citrus x aurantiifolia]